MQFDRQPPQLLRYMRSLAGDRNDNIVRHIFLQRMLQTIQTILAIVDNDASLDKIVEVAHQIMEHTSIHKTIACQQQFE